MSLTVHDLVLQRIFRGVRLRAGSAGAGAEINWINIMEILDSPESVQPGELLFTTGSGLSCEAQHLHLLDRLKARGVCGMAIQVGYYIDDIPDYILQKANRIGFPVLSLPRDLTFSEILHTMMQLLSHNRQAEHIDDVIRQAYLALDKGLHARLGEFFTSCEEHHVQLSLLTPANYSRADEKGWKKCLSQIDSFVHSNSDHCLAIEFSKCKYLFLTAHHRGEDFLSMLYGLNIKITFLSEQYGTNFLMGTDRLPSPDMLKQALGHILDALDTLWIIQAKRGICSYAHIQFVKMFGQLHRKDSSLVLDNQSLQVLFNYDKINGTNYLQTLRVYLANSCNATKTAAQLFVHRHTLLKRLAKISAIGQMDLEDYYTRIYMSVALMFHDYFIY